MLPYLKKYKKSKISLHNISGKYNRFLSAYQKGIMTIEAAVVLPLFMFAIITMLYLISIVRIENEVGYALDQTGKLLSQYSYASSLGGQDSNPSIPVNALSSLYAKSEIISLAGSERINNSCIKNGALGITCFLNPTDVDNIELTVKYKIELPLKLFNLKDINIIQSVKVKKWTGYKPPDSDGVEMVYVTETGTVYHTNINCSYLQLSISQVNKNELDSLRNNSGAKYYKCEKCGSKFVGSNKVFITNSGNKYHTSLDCSGLKRSIMSIPITQVGGKAKCSRCG